MNLIRTSGSMERIPPHSVRRAGSILALLSWILLPASAQHDRLTFERMTLREGLSQSIVEGIIQDRQGFLWMATEDGLNMYDGYTFRVLRNDPMDIHSLSHNEIRTLIEDTAGTLWVGTFAGGLNRYLPSRQMFVRYRHSPDDSTSISNDIITAICQDRDGTIWVGTSRGLNRVVLTPGTDTTARFIRYHQDPSDPSGLGNDTIRSLLQDHDGTLWVGTNGGLYCLAADALNDPGPRFRSYRHDPSDRTSLSNSVVRSLYEDRSGTLWVGTDEGLNRAIRRDGSSRNLSFRHYVHDPENPRSLSSNEVYVMFEDSSGSFWVGTNGGGLNLFDRTGETFQRYIHDPRDPSSLSYNEIRSLFQDRSGLLWVGTYGGGVNKVDTRRKPFVHYRADPETSNSLNQEIVWSIFEDSEGILWLGTHGGGLNRFDRKRNQFTFYRSTPANPRTLSSDIVRNVLGDGTGAIWVGTNGGGVCRLDPRTGLFTRFLHDNADSGSISHNEIRALYLDREGLLWIGTYGGGLDRIDPSRWREGRFSHFRHSPRDSTSISSDFVRALYEDRSGFLWVGTHGGGLNRFDHGTGIFTRFSAEPLQPGGLSNNFVFCVYQDSSGVIWIATWGGGLNRYDPASGLFSWYGEKDGLPGDAIYGILEDSRRNLWLSSNNGICKFNPRETTFRNYAVRDGLQEREFNAGAYFKSRSGEMFFGGINGFNAFVPEKIRDNPYIPPIALTAFRKLNEPVDFGQPLAYIREISLSHRDYFFSFEFAALDYTSPEENLYAYMMEGLDEGWIRTTSSNRHATYTTLPAGSYTFRVIGSNSDGVWNRTGTRVTVIIQPPFWRTWGFLLFTVAALCLLALTVYRRRLRAVRMRAELHAAHEAQMTIMPHEDPRVPGLDVSGICIPANEVGGDFFDYFADEERPFGIMVGDVSGKAMRGAMTAVLASGIINTELTAGRPINEVLERTNRLLFRKTDRDVFTAACIAVIDRENSRLGFANAGLNKPLLLSGQTVVSLDPEGSTHPLGMTEHTTYAVREVTVSPGDVLLFQTDGIVEAQNRSRDLYGEERLVTLLRSLDTANLSARAIRDAVLDDVRSFTSSVPQHDDMSIVVVKLLT